MSRLVPRKGLDRLIEASAGLAGSHPDLEVLLAGTGRDRGRLQRLVDDRGAPVRFLDRVPDAELPALYGLADIFAMVCRVRWAGLEQEGFGIVFLEAAAAGVPQVAGRSGGSDEAVVDQETGFVVDDPTSTDQVRSALQRLLGDPDLRAAMGLAARRRAVEAYGYDQLAERLQRCLELAAAGEPLPDGLRTYGP